MSFLLLLLFIVCVHCFDPSLPFPVCDPSDVENAVASIQAQADEASPSTVSEAQASDFLPLVFSISLHHFETDAVLSNYRCGELYRVKISKSFPPNSISVLPRIAGLLLTVEESPGSGGGTRAGYFLEPESSDNVQRPLRIHPTCGLGSNVQWPTYAQHEEWPSPTNAAVSMLWVAPNQVQHSIHFRSVVVIADDYDELSPVRLLQLPDLQVSSECGEDGAPDSAGLLSSDVASQAESELATLFDEVLPAMGARDGDIDNLRRQFAPSMTAGRHSPLANFDFLRNRGLNGVIPPAIGQMQSLRVIRLNGNSLTGPFPPELFHLNHLQMLDLDNSAPTYSRNDASLGFDRGIPDDIRRLTELRILDLDQCGLNQALPFSALESLTRLIDFEVSDNFFLPPSLVPQAITRWQRLVRLNLGRSNFQGPLPVGFSELRSLQSLQLAGNAISGNLLAALSNLPLSQECDLVDMSDSSELNCFFCLPSLDLLPSSCTGSASAGSIRDADDTCATLEVCQSAPPTPSPTTLSPTAGEMPDSPPSHLSTSSSPFLSVVASNVTPGKTDFFSSDGNGIIPGVSNWVLILVLSLIVVFLVCGLALWCSCRRRRRWSQSSAHQQRQRRQHQTQMSRHDIIPSGTSLPVYNDGRGSPSPRRRSRRNQSREKSRHASKRASFSLFPPPTAPQSKYVTPETSNPGSNRASSHLKNQNQKSHYASLGPVKKTSDYDDVFSPLS